MSTDRWQTIKKIFEDALELPAEERPAFLNRVCAGQPEDRAEVESLLSSLDEADDFLDRPAMGEVADLIAGKPATFAEGQQLGQYRVERSIGAGGMGEIYLATDERLDRQVALKLLPAKFGSDADRARRFTQEARAASALNHPNIITIYEIDETESHQLFIATEYIQGQTLRQYLGTKTPTLREIIEIAVQIANALSAAHTAGIVHRDIKPENVMIRPDGIVKVLDFGLAKLAERPIETVNSRAETISRYLTAPGLVMGTVNYMSPEQARGLDVDGRTDIFSLGVLLYEMVAGQTPFASDTNADTVAAILHTDPTPLSKVVAELPAELQRIVGKMLRKDHDERYQSAKDLLIDLKDLRDELQLQTKLARAGSDGSGNGMAARLVPGTVQPTGLIAQASGENQERVTVAMRTVRRRWWIGAAAAGLIVALVIGGWWWWRSRHAPPFSPAKVISILQLSAWPGQDDFAAISRDGKFVAYSSDHTGHFEVFVKSLAPGANETQLTTDGQENLEPAWSPDGQYLAYYSRLKRGIWVIPAAGGTARQVADFGSYPSWSPDGAQIAFQSTPINDLAGGSRSALGASTIWLVAVAGGEPKQLTQIGVPSGGHGAPIWSPDGRWVVFSANIYSDGDIWIVPAAGGPPKQLAKEGDSPVIAPDGKSIFWTQGSLIQQAAFDQKTGAVLSQPEPIRGLASLQQHIRRFSITGDGRRLVYSAMTRRESIESVKLGGDLRATGNPETLVHNTSSRTHMPSFSADGKRFAFVNCQPSGTGCDIWLVNADGGDQQQVTTDPESELEPSWFPNQTEIGYAVNGVYWKIDLNTKRKTQLLTMGESGASFAVLSPDGQHVVYNHQTNGVINIWLAKIGSAEAKQISFGTELTGFPAWSPDGKTIAFQQQHGNDTNLFMMPVSGGPIEQLTFDAGQSWAHGWAPDGDKVLFAGNRDGIWNVWWVSRSTKKEQRVTNYSRVNSFVRYPSWSPKGDQIVYEYSETTGNIWLAEIQ
jgi:serine/threonine protein kinase/Tol biopolymer transport system component